MRNTKLLLIILLAVGLTMPVPTVEGAPQETTDGGWALWLRTFLPWVAGGPADKSEGDIGGSMEPNGFAGHGDIGGNLEPDGFTGHGDGNGDIRGSMEPNG
jgi:hypothetical protein